MWRFQGNKVREETQKQGLGRAAGGAPVWTDKVVFGKSFVQEKLGNSGWHIDTKQQARHLNKERVCDLQKLLQPKPTCF